MKKIHFTFLLTCCTLLYANAQKEEMETDRPGQSFTPVTTLKKTFQVEFGFSEKSQKKVEKKHEEFLYPTTLLKYGLTEKFELRMQVEYEGDYDFSPSKQKTGAGFKPVQFGIKYNLFKGSDFIPNIAIIAGAAIPTFASGGFKGEFVAPTFIAALENDLSKALSLTYNVGIQWESSDVHAEYLYTVAPQLKISKTFKIFCELYGIFQNDTKPDHRVDAGIACSIRQNLQVDVLGGVGLSKSSPNHFMEVGCSFRLPH